MRQIRMIHPAYSEGFSCVSSACEDTCCKVWEIDVNPTTYTKLQSLPAGPLRSLVDEHVVPKQTEPATLAEGPFAIIQLLPSGYCPFLSEERLCRVHAEFGVDYLSHNCLMFPRETHTIDGQTETALALSCPEAARLVLLTPDLVESAAYPSFPWDETAPGVADLRAYFWIIRDFSIRLIRNQTYSLWQRMLLLGLLSRRLDSIAHGELNRDFPGLFLDFTAAVSNGGLRANLEGVPADPGLYLELLLGMVNQRITPDAGQCLNTERVLRLDTTLPLGDDVQDMHDPETLHAFAQCIGEPPEVSREQQIANYARAGELYAEPFFREHPYFLENYLINQIFRNTFPLGMHLYDPSQPLDFAEAYSRLAIQFALVKGILTGIAGFYKEEFNTARAVNTVYASFRYFEHNTSFLERTRAFLAARNLNNAQGLTTLVRN